MVEASRRAGTNAGTRTSLNVCRRPEEEEKKSLQKGWRTTQDGAAGQQQQSLCPGVYRQPHPLRGQAPPIAAGSGTSPPPAPLTPPPRAEPSNSQPWLRLVSHARGRCAAQVEEVEGRWGRGLVQLHTVMKKQVPLMPRLRPPVCDRCSCVNTAARDRLCSRWGEGGHRPLLRPVPHPLLLPLEQRSKQSSESSLRPPSHIPLMC